MMLSLILFTSFVGSVIAMLLLIWLKKDTVVEYAKLLGLTRLFKIDEFEQVSANDPNMTYPKFLAWRSDNFFTRLINCPVCLAVWLGILFNVFSYTIFAVILQVWLVNLVAIPGALASAYVGLVLYFSLLKLMT